MRIRTVEIPKTKIPKRELRVALVHDYLNQYGGAERVFETIAEMFPTAPIYTLFYDENLMGGRFTDRDIRTSFADRPFIRKHHRLFIPLFPKAAQSLDLKDNYDIIISDSAGFGKGISYASGYHVSYAHSPLRYAWEPKYYLGTLFSKGMIAAGQPLISYVRRWDKKMGERPDFMFSNSNHTAEKIRRFYKRDTEILHPPLDTEKFFYDPPAGGQGHYFLAFGRFVHYKRFDLVVEAFNELGLPLIILGTGPHAEEIKKLIRSKNIKFINEHLSDDSLRRIISGAKATIFPQVEDFGMVAVESLACGTPVIAFRQGGAKEIVDYGHNGLFFRDQSTEGISRAVHAFNLTHFDPHTVSESAQKFSKENFKRRLLEVVHSL